MGWVLKASLATAAALGLSLAASQSASAATYSCNSTISVNDVGPSLNKTGSAPCTAPVNSPQDPDLINVLGRSTVTGDGLVTARSIATVTTSVFAGTNSQSSLSDVAVVTGLQAGGADVMFDISAIAFLAASTTGASPFAAPTATAGFDGSIFLFTDGGASTTVRYTGCDRNDAPGISVCNGVFNATDAGSYHAQLNPTIHLVNGDVLHFNINTNTTALTATPGPFTASAQGLLTFRWGGVRFDDASRGLVLVGTDGFDYARPVLAGAAPEPASWAVMIVGFGAAGAVLRRRRAALA